MNKRKRRRGRVQHGPMPGPEDYDAIEVFKGDPDLDELITAARAVLNGQGGLLSVYYRDRLRKALEGSE